MADTIDTLQLEISSSSQQAEAGIDRLIDALDKLQGSLGGFQKRGLNSFINGMGKLSNVANSVDGDKLTALSNSFEKLTVSLEGLAGAQQQLDPTIKNLQRLAKIDFSKLQIDGGFSGLVGLASGTEAFAKAATSLAAIKPTEINRVTAFLQKLGGAAQSLRAFDGVNVSALKDLGASFASFTSSLAGSEKVPAAVSKIFNSLSQLSASAGNLPAVAAGLQPLSEETLRFIASISSAPVVPAGTASVVTALSGIASAGGKAQKAAGALPGLTQGIAGFVTVLSELPALDDKIVRAIDALSRLSATGGKAGTAARGLQKDIKGLSVTMETFRGSTKKAVGGLGSLAKQLLSMAGIAGGFYALIRGINASITAASDLSEAENVIAQGFGSMSDKIEEFSKTSIEAFGMSELAAKNTAGIFAVMGKSLGLSQDNATDMAVALTALTGDLASFYNVSQDVANTALKSVFTGETESLKRFGIVMTEANLKAFALSKGIDKSISSMTQAEKTQLRYAFVMDAASSAMGDFARTSSGSWANQVRILSQSFQQLAGIVGGGLMAAFLPVIKVINAVIAKIIQLAQTISSFLGSLFGFKKAVIGGGSGLADIADSAGAAAGGLEDAAGGVSDVGGAAGKASKQLNKFVAGWHEVTSMSSEDTSGSGGGGGGVSMPDMTLPSDYTFGLKADDEVSPALERIKKRFLELAGLFKKGFDIGLGDTDVFDSIKENFKSIKESLLDIFTAESVVDAFNEMIDTLVYNAGRKIGAFLSIGATILDNITAGIARYLGTAGERIKQYLVDMFNITAVVDTIVTDFIVAVSDIFTVFRSDDAKQITADIIQIFVDGFMGVTELAAKLGRDLLALILDPITENAEKIKEAIANTLAPIREVFDTLAASFTSTWEEINRMYDEHIQPLFRSLTDGISEIVGTLLDGYSTYIAPTLDSLAAKFSQIWTGSIQPMISNFIGLIGDAADFLKQIWETILKPFIDWVAQKIMPVVAPVLQQMGESVLGLLEQSAESFDGIITAARGLIEFLSGTFSGDWEKAWSGIKTTFSGIWDTLPSSIKDPIEEACRGLTAFLDGTFSGDWERAWEGVKDTFGRIWDAMPDLVKGPIEDIVQFVNDMVAKVGQGIDDLIDKVKDVATGGISGLFSGNGRRGRDGTFSIPAFASGGVVSSPTVALIGEAGSEAVVPLSRNAQWIDAVAQNLTRCLGGPVALDLSIPERPDIGMPMDIDVRRTQQTLQMEFDTMKAEMEYRDQQMQAAMERHTQVLEQVLKQGIILDDNEFTKRYKRSATSYRRRTGVQLGLY